MIRDIFTLAFEFAQRDFKERYVGTGLGQLWYLLSPVITIFIYTVIFSDFMKMRLDISQSAYAYSIYLVPGLLAWTSFSTLVSRLNVSFFDKAHLIKKINVPMYTFQLSIVFTELFLLCLSLGLGILFLLIVNHSVGWVFLWLIPLVVLQVLFAFGLGVILSLFSPFVRDLKEAVPIVLQLWFWMTPIVYMREMIEGKYPLILTLNPFYPFVEMYQNIFLYSREPSVESLLIVSALAFVSLAFAALLYKKMIATIKDII